MVAGAVLRVRAGEAVIGGAFLVAPGVVATSTHVVAEALGADPLAAPPPEPVGLDFPLLRDERDAPATVTATVHEWTPGGVALLRLADPPAGARMPPLRRIDVLDERSFSVLGFPEGLGDGVWATGVVRAERGVHLLHGNAGEQHIDSGFSGVPVWETGTGAVVGMAVAPYGAEPIVMPIDEVAGLDPERLPCPYRGLRAFDEEHADTFFGRDDDIARLLDAAATLPVVTVAGPSGAGKSSLVRAGLVPRLRAGGAEIVYLRAEPGTTVAPPEPGDSTVLVVDQFEELAALDPAAARSMMERIVALTQEHRVRAVLTVRWTTLDDLLTPELIATLEAGTVLVGSLDRERLHDAIVRPAEHPPGLAFEDGLVERILDDAGAEPGQLPLVASLLTDLWERREGGYLTLRDYDAAGGVAGAIAQHAERVVGGLPDEREEPLRRLLVALARPDHGGRFVRRAVPIDDLPAPQRDLVPALTAGRLLVVTRSAGTADVVELAHQALIDHWPRLSTWLADDGEFLAWRDRVGDQRERWEGEDKADTALLRGATLAAASRWLSARTEDLPAADVEYVRRSTARQRREVRRWRVITAVVAVLAVGAAVLTVVTVRSGDRVAAQLATANADTLGRESQARAPTDPIAAAQLALAAWREDPRHPQARTALASSYVAMRGIERELPGMTSGPITDMVVGGDTAVLLATPHATLLTGLSGPAPRSEALPDLAPDRQVSVSPDGRWVAIQTPDRSAIQLRDLRSADPPVTLPRPDGSQAGQPRFSSDSIRLSWIVLDSANRNTLRIIDLVSGADVRHGVGSLPADVAAVYSTSDPGKVLMRRGTSTNSRLVTLSLVDGAELDTKPDGAAVALFGAAVATCEPNGQPLDPATVVVTPTNGEQPLRVPMLGGSCGTSGGPVLTTNGRALVDAPADRRSSDHGPLRLTDLDTGAAYTVDAPLTPTREMSARFGVERTLALTTVGGRPMVVWARGTSLLWLRAEPPAEAPPRGERLLDVLDGYRILRSRDAIFTTENGSGRRLGAVAGIDPDARIATESSGTLWSSRIAPKGWEVTQFELPSLRKVNDFVAPSRGGAPAGDERSPPALWLDRAQPEDGGLVYAVGDGVLSAWDPVSARPAGPPIPLGDNERQAGFIRSFPFVLARPGHPGQVAALSGDDLKLWDAVQGRLLATLPIRADLDRPSLYGVIGFDDPGRRLVVLARDPVAVQVWDVDTAQQVRPPIPAPATRRLIGIDSDGYLQMVVASGTDERVVSLDLETGAESGAMDLLNAASTSQRDEGRSVRSVSYDGKVVDLPVTAQAWHDALCGVVNRPFTQGERDLLPPGANPAPPC